MKWQIAKNESWPQTNRKNQSRQKREISSKLHSSLSSNARRRRDISSGAINRYEMLRCSQATDRHLSKVN